MTSFKIKQPKQRCCVHVAVSFHSGFVFSGGGPEEVCAKRTHLLTPVSITAEKEKRESSWAAEAWSALVSKLHVSLPSHC